MGFLFYSATLLVGLLLSIIFINIGTALNKKYSFMFLSAIIFFITFLLLKSNNNCNDRIFFISDNEKWIIYEDELSGLSANKPDINDFNIIKEQLIFSTQDNQDLFLNKINPKKRKKVQLKDLISKNMNTNKKLKFVDNQYYINFLIEVHNNIVLKENLNINEILITNIVNPVQDLSNLTEKINYEELISLISEIIKKYEKKKKIIRRIINTSSNNLTTSVHLNSINLGLITLIDRPFGWGLNRFEYAFKYYMPNLYVKFHEMRVLNYNDGASNLSKLIVEFGIFSIFLFIFFVYWSFSNKINITSKIFLIPLIVTQLIRGAGYFNGGFLLVVLLMFSLLYNNKNKVKNE